MNAKRMLHGSDRESCSVAHSVDVSRCMMCTHVLEKCGGVESRSVGQAVGNGAARGRWIFRWVHVEFKGRFLFTNSSCSVDGESVNEGEKRQRVERLFLFLD